MNVYKLSMIRGGAPTETSYFVVAEEEIKGVYKERFTGLTHKNMEKVLSEDLTEVSWDVGHGIRVTLTKLLEKEAKGILQKIKP